MPLLPGQKEIIKELIVEPYLDTLREAYPERIPKHEPSFESIIWACFHPSSCTIYSNNP